MRVEYEVLREDYDQACRAQGAKQTRGRRSRGVGYLAIAAGVLFLAAQYNQPGAVPSAGLVALGLYLLISPIWSAYAQVEESWKDGDRIRQPITLELTEHGLRFSGKTFDSECRWLFFDHIVETRDLFLLYATPTRLIQTIPKRAFDSPERVDEFRRLLNANIATPTNAFPVIPTAGTGSGTS
jgi:hypothetical protein